MLFGANLKKYRKGKGFTQEDLAKMLGISRQAVVSYENGRREPSLMTLIKIANCLCVSTDRLLSRDEYSIQNNVEVVRNHIKKIIGNRDLEDFCKEVGLKTGFVLSTDKLESYVLGKVLPDKIVLKVLAMYAGMDVESFYI
jgi:transcriptional regulator with XRE-family HTH domain